MKKPKKNLDFKKIAKIPETPAIEVPRFNSANYLMPLMECVAKYMNDAGIDEKEALVQIASMSRAGLLSFVNNEKGEEFVRINATKEEADEYLSSEEGIHQMKMDQVVLRAALKDK